MTEERGGAPIRPPVLGQIAYYVPQSNQGLGESAVPPNATGGSGLTAEMTELDLHPGSQVLYHSDDADSEWPIIQWIDDKGIDRRTTIEPSVFQRDFKSS